MIPPDTHDSQWENAISTNCAAPDTASDATNAPLDRDLQTIIERWMDLPVAVKAGILAMVRVK
jgi:hypothetical protein